MKEFAAGAYINTFGNTSDQCHKIIFIFAKLCILVKYDIECGNILLKHTIEKIRYLKTR